MVRSKKARANWTSSKWRRSQQKKRKSSTCDSDVASSSFWGQSQRGFSAQTLDNGSNNLQVTVVGCTSRHSNIWFWFVLWIDHIKRASFHLVSSLEDKRVRGNDDKRDSRSSGRHPCYLHCLLFRVLGPAQGNCVVNSLKQCRPIPVNGLTLLKPSHCLALKWDRIATRSVFTGCYVWMGENDSGLTCLRGNPKAPATTTKNHQTQTFSNVFLAKLGVLSYQSRIDFFQLEIILFNLLVESFRIVDMLWGKPEPRQTDRSRAGHRARWRGVSQLIHLEGRLILLRC